MDEFVPIDNKKAIKLSSSQKAILFRFPPQVNLFIINFNIFILLFFLILR